MTPRMLRMMQALAGARRTYERIQAGTFGGTPVYRASPGCTRSCPRCDIACAVTVGEIYDLEQQIATASTVSRCGSAFVITEAGHA